jgi:hypothetical protein
MEWDEFIKNLPIAVSLVTIYVGYSAWQRDYIGKRRIDLAEEVLSLFYQARDAIKIIRNPAQWEGEGSTRKRKDGKRPDESKILDSAYVVVERYEKEKCCSPISIHPGIGSWLASADARQSHSTS